MSDIFRSCPFCGKELQATLLDNGTHIAADCDVCGNYIFKFNNSNTELNDKIASYLFYHKDDIKRTCFFIGERSFYESKYKDEPRVKYVSIDEIENWYPKTFAEKVDKFLLYLDSCSNYLGDIVLFSKETIYSACFVKRNPSGAFVKITDAQLEQTKFFTKYLSSQNYCKYHDYRIEILAEGYKRIDELQKEEQTKSTNAFIAMSYAPEMSPAEDAIREAVIKSGYDPVILKDVEHNHQIVPEMLYQIRQAKFVVAELTNHNNGAYYEAGYALASGKEVIHLCKRSSFRDDAHFDVAQINTILWEDEKDLTEKLIKRIEATIE